MHRSPHSQTVDKVPISLAEFAPAGANEIRGGIQFCPEIPLTERTVVVVARLIAPLYPKGAKLRYSPAPPLQTEAALPFGKGRRK